MISAWGSMFWETGLLVSMSSQDRRLCPPSRDMGPLGQWRLLLDGRCLLSNHAVENAEKPDVLEQRNDLEAGSVNRVRPVVMPGSPVTCGCCYK